MDIENAWEENCCPGQILSALGQKLHPSCFVCCVCGKGLWNRISLIMHNNICQVLAKASWRQKENHSVSIVTQMRRRKNAGGATSQLSLWRRESSRWIILWWDNLFIWRNNWIPSCKINCCSTPHVFRLWELRLVQPTIVTATTASAVTSAF